MTIARKLIDHQLLLHVNSKYFYIYLVKMYFLQWISNTDGQYMQIIFTVQLLLKRAAKMIRVIMQSYICMLWRRDEQAQTHRPIGFKNLKTAHIWSFQNSENPNHQTLKPKEKPQATSFFSSILSSSSSFLHISLHGTLQKVFLFRFIYGPSSFSAKFFKCAFVLFSLELMKSLKSQQLTSVQNGRMLEVM